VNHYEVLGVSQDATPSQIRSAFRRLARAHHPDTSVSGSAASLAPINDAWRVLGDPELRRAYASASLLTLRQGLRDGRPGSADAAAAIRRILEEAL